ncbi:MAG: MBL fold metallo-hydrolase [Coriobacteriales bacterium]|jgi:glyoxylase-like metal-dependent hydrolase (beta-lactamase superfamily II)|nr:MBL fold metallo-hydrolase [Coriobacteriales bacterium]
MKVQTIPVRIARNPHFTTNCYVLSGVAETDELVDVRVPEAQRTAERDIAKECAGGAGEANPVKESSPGTTEIAVVIDPGDQPERILAALGSAKLVAILLTHGHYDHIGGVASLAHSSGAKVYAHELDAEAIATNYQQIRNGYAAFSKKLYGRFKDFHNPLLSNIAPRVDVLLRDGEHITFGDINLEIIHTPGHTRGSICLYDQAGAQLFSGDTLFKGTCGRTDFVGGSPASMHTSLQRLKELPPETLVLPGHDEPTSIGAELELGLSEY